MKDNHDLKERFALREKAQAAAQEFVEGLEYRELQYLAWDIVSLNEDWALNHPNTVGREMFESSGLTTNQKKWLKMIDNKLKDKTER